MQPEKLVEHFTLHPQLDGADPALLHFLKFLPPAPETPELRVSTRGMFVDMTELPRTLDFSRASADCDILKDIIARSGPDIVRAMELFKRAAKESHQASALEALKICTEMGLTEKNFSEKGGGFLFLLVIVIFAAGCATCTQGGTYPPVNHPK